jgi:O-acetylserine/cysteine efflux transporter
MTPRDLLIVFVICLAWAGNFLTSALALRELSPLLYTALRLLLLGVLLLPFLKPPPRAMRVRLVAVALCNGVLHFGLSFWAIKLAGDLASPAIVMQSYVPMAAVIAWFLLGERFAWRTGLAILVSFAGILVLGFDPLVLDHPGSLSLMLVSAFFLALGTVLMRDLKGIDALSVQGWTAWIGTLPLLAASTLMEPDPLHQVTSVSAIAWLGVAYAAVIASMLGHGLFYLLVQRHAVAQITPYLLMTPLFAVALGIAFWGDRPGTKLWIGGAMVLGGVLAIALRTWAKQRALGQPARRLG